MRTGPDPDGPSTPSLTRRALLGATAAGALAACSTSTDAGTTSATASGTGSAQPSPGATVPPPNATDAVGAALRAVGLDDARLALTPQATWAELLVGLTTNLLFVVTDDAGGVVNDAVDVWLVDLDGQAVVGPLASTWHPDDRLPTMGLHAVEVALDEDAVGTYDLVVASADGSRAGTAGIQALPPEQSIAPAPGAMIPALATPTTDDEMGLAELCTREENCGLHDVSLDDALGGGDPVVLCISTPKYCQTAICGPVLDDVRSVAVADDAPAATFIHVEPYTDDQLTPTELVNELRLPTEPWTYVLQPDGTIIERYPGPVLPDLLRAALDRVPVAAATPSSSPTSSTSPGSTPPSPAPSPS